MKARTVLLMTGVSVGLIGPLFAQEEARTKLTPRALELIQAAKENLDAKQHAEAARARGQQRQKALEIAVQFAKDRLKERVGKERDAQRQVQLAREHQLKALYERGLALYQHGAYQEAIQALEKMALIDPLSPLVKQADQIISRAELKRFEQRLRASAESPQTSGAVVPELEERLTQKRIELETVLKYARLAMQERKYDTALKLLTALLVQDPDNRDAKKLVEEIQLAKLGEEHDTVQRQVEQDERAMINDVLKAQVLPESRQAALTGGRMVATDPGAALSAKLQEPVSFEFNEVALGDVLDFLADAASVSLIPSPQLDLKNQRVSMKVSQLPLEQAIKYLTKSLSLAYRTEQDAILIASPEEFSSEPMDTRVFFLRNGLGPFALETAAIEQNPSLSALESLKALITKSIPQPPDSKFILDERSGAIIVTNTAEHLRQLERLLSELDVTPIQVLIEARFLELTETELEQLGLESVLTEPAPLTKKDAGDGTKGPGHQLAKGGGIKFPALTREGEALNFTLEGVLTGTQFETVLHALAEDKKTKTLSAPRVTTLNNQTALIRVVEEFNYPTRYEVSLIQFDINGDGDFDDAGETEFANVPKDLQKRDIGILLNVTPSVGKDLKTVTLVLAPEVSAFSQFRDLGGGVTVPEFTSSQLTTSVLIEDGQTVVLGGLMKDTTTTQRSKVPVLGDLPLVGPLFRQTEETNTRKNLLIFITARVLAPHGRPTT